MTYSLVVIHKQEHGKVSGSWLQDHVGTLETASECARDTETANSSKVTVAVVEGIACRSSYYGTPVWDRLDV